MTEADLPPWPATPVACGPVVLREFSMADVAMAMELSTDPYVPLIGTLPAHASTQEARAWVDRQRCRWAEGTGFSFAIAEAGTDSAVGTIGLWLAHLPRGRASAGYFVAPSARGHGIASAALTAVTSFGWSIPALHRIELYIEPWNVGSIKTAEQAGYEREGLLRSYQETSPRHAALRRRAKTVSSHIVRALRAALPDLPLPEPRIVDVGFGSLVIDTGDGIVVRVRRTAVAAAGHAVEAAVLPTLAPMVPVAIPAPAYFCPPATQPRSATASANSGQGQSSAKPKGTRAT